MIYCKKCKYYNATGDSKGECQCPDNIKKKSNWYFWEQKYDEKPHQKNKDNDCEWFKLKGK